MPPVRVVDDGMVLEPAERVGLSQNPPAEWLPRMNAARTGRPWATPLGVADTPVRARVDAGRWIVDCPHCPNAAWVTWRDPRFWCTQCENVRVSGRWLPVQFPSDVVREEAERVLAVRTHAEQFWFPERESAVDLMAENLSVLSLPPFENY